MTAMKHAIERFMGYLRYERNASPDTRCAITSVTWNNFMKFLTPPGDSRTPAYQGGPSHYSRIHGLAVRAPPAEGIRGAQARRHADIFQILHARGICDPESGAACEHAQDSQAGPPLLSAEELNNFLDQPTRAGSELSRQSAAVPRRVAATLKSRYGRSAGGETRPRNSQSCSTHPACASVSLVGLECGQTWIVVGKWFVSWARDVRSA